MYADWGKAARAYIAQEIAKLPEDASLDDRRKALRRFAGEFHGGTSHGRKVWSRECRKYLQQHGLPPLASQESPRYKRPDESPKFSAADHAFPFRQP